MTHKQFLSLQRGDEITYTNADISVTGRVVYGPNPEGALRIEWSDQESCYISEHRAKTLAKFCKRKKS